jgi:hypothetical protein
LLLQNQLQLQAMRMQSHNPHMQKTQHQQQQLEQDTTPSAQPRSTTAPAAEQPQA